MTSIPNELFLQWDPAQVSSYVASVLPEEHSNVASTFILHNIDGLLLPFITTNHLKELGISALSHRLLIKKSITSLITTHYQNNPPQSLNDPEYKLTNININNNYVSLESLTLSTVIMKDLFRKLSHSIYDSPMSPQHNIDIQRLNENFTKLKTDLIPVIRLLKDLKPLPTPTLDPGPAAKVNSPTYSVQSVPSTVDPVADNPRIDLSRSNSVSTTKPSVPSPTFSNRYSSGSLLLMGTGKVVSQTIKPEKPELVHKTLGRVRPRLVESKSSSAALGSMVTDEDYSTLTADKPPLNSRGSLSSTHTVETISPKQGLAPVPGSEPLKQLRASSDDSCRKILTQAMKRHRIPEHDWSKYVLVICYGDKERILKLDERPVIIFKELQELGKHPAIMLRQLAAMTETDEDHYDSRIGDDIPGGTL